MTHVAHSAIHAPAKPISFRRGATGVIALALAIVSFLLFRGTMPVYSAGEVISGTSSDIAMLFALACLIAAYVAYHTLVGQGIGVFVAIMVVASFVLMI